MSRGTHELSAGPDGVIVGRRRSGSVEASRHLDWRLGGERWHYRGAPLVGLEVDAGSSGRTGWERYTRVFAGLRSIAGRLEVLAVTADGGLILHEYDMDTRRLVLGPIQLAVGRRDGPRRSRRAGTEWDRYARVFAGSDGAVYAVDEDGSLLHTTLIIDGDLRRLSSAEPTRLVRGRGPGTGWGAYRHVTAGSDGSLYAVRNDGSLAYRRHLGWRDGSPHFAELAGTVLTTEPDAAMRWNEFVHVFAGTEGRLFGVKPDGSLITRRHIGWRSGSNRWERSSETVITEGTGPGTSWDEFVDASSRSWCRRALPVEDRCALTGSGGTQRR